MYAVCVVNGEMLYSFLHEEAHFLARFLRQSASTAWLKSGFDMGFIVGAILAGLASDVTTHYAGMPMRSPIVSGFLLISLLPMGVMRFSTDTG